MYARVARFEGVDTAAMDAQIAEMKSQMAATAAGGVPEGAPAEIKTLMNTVTRFMQLLDRESGTAIGIAFCETEDDARRAHAALDAMSPSGGEGKRTSAQIFEVGLDQTV